MTNDVGLAFSVGDTTPLVLSKTITVGDILGGFTGKNRRTT